MASMHRKWARSPKNRQFLSQKPGHARRMPAKKVQSDKPVRVQHPAALKVEKPKRVNPVMKFIGRLFTRGGGAESR